MAMTQEGGSSPEAKPMDLAKRLVRCVRPHWRGRGGGHIVVVAWLCLLGHCSGCCREII